MPRAGCARRKYALARYGRIALTLLFVELIAMPGHAQDDGTDAEAQASAEPLEEVTVFGQRSLGAMQREVYRAEDRFFGPMLPVEPMMQHKAQLLNDEMRVLLQQHPELLEALADFSRLKSNLDSERERRCGGRHLSCTQ